jgi:hypothetical protein
VGESTINDDNLPPNMIEAYNELSNEEREIIKKEVTLQTGRCVSQMAEASEAYQIYGSIRIANQRVMGLNQKGQRSSSVVTNNPNHRDL